MGFKDVNDGFGYDIKQKATDLAMGESFTGHLLATGQRADKETGKIMLSLFFLVGDKKVLFYPAGNINYMIKDGKLVVGRNTQITRIADKKVKSMKSSQYTVLQDAEDTIDVTQFADGKELSSETLGDADVPKTTRPPAQTKAAARAASLADKSKRLEEAQ